MKTITLSIIITWTTTTIIRIPTGSDIFMIPFSMILTGIIHFRGVWAALILTLDGTPDIIIHGTSIRGIMIRGIIHGVITHIIVHGTGEDIIHGIRHTITRITTTITIIGTIMIIISGMPVLPATAGREIPMLFIVEAGLVPRR